MKTVSLVAAVAENEVIGVNGMIPWNLEADKKRLTSLVTNKDVICTWNGYQEMWFNLSPILALARNIFVLTRAHLGTRPTIWKSPIQFVESLEDALLSASGEVMILGAFEEALPKAQRIYLTRVHVEIFGDKKFPDLDMLKWECVNQEARHADKKNQFPYSFITLEKIEEKEENTCPLCRENRRKFFSIPKEERNLDILWTKSDENFFPRGSFIAATKFHESTIPALGSDPQKIINWLKANNHGDYKIESFEEVRILNGHPYFSLEPA